MFEQTSALLFKNSFPRVPHIQCVIDGPQDADVSPVSPALTHALSILFFNPVFCKKNKKQTPSRIQRGIFTKGEVCTQRNLWLEHSCGYECGCLRVSVRTVAVCR